MAAESRRTTLPVAEALFAEPGRFEFVQAVRLLALLHARRAGRLVSASADEGEADGDEAARLDHRIGGDADPADEPVRFRAVQSLTFPPAEIARLQHAGEDAPPEMEVAFLGLTGPSGTLPQHYTELVIRGLREKNRAMRDFFDLFNHRAVSLFYRAWAKYRLPIAYEADRGRGEDAVTAVLSALIGFGTPGLRGRLAVDDQTLVHYAGLFSHAPKSAAALEAMVGDYFGRPIRIEQFRGHWIYLGTDETTLLPSPEMAEGRYCRLGVDAVVGERVWNVQSRFRIRIGPLSYAAFRRFMPDGGDLRRLFDLTRSFVGPTLTFDVELTLAKEEVPALRLGGEGEGGAEADGPRLGWNTWLKNREFLADAADAVFVLRQ